MKAYLVYHHHSEQIQQCSKEQAIQEVLRIDADSLTENVKYDLSQYEGQHAEEDVEQWPAILQRLNHQNQLHDHVHCHE